MRPRGTTWLIGGLLFVVFAVAMAPATLVRQLLPADSGVELLNLRGSLWDGQADLLVNALPLGSVRWDYRAVTLLQGRLGYDLTWEGPDHALTARAGFGLTGWQVAADGRLAAAFVNRALAPYDIAITGGMEVREVALAAPYRWNGTGSASGSARWQGGAVRYRLANQVYDGQLPPLAAFLGDGLEAVIYPEDGQTPLLRAEIQGNGFARIGVTRKLTELLGNPWPGSHQDHEVVLEVEEQLF
jgi:hypothetical protein